MTMWTIKFDNGEWSYIDPSFISSRRTDAWAKWVKEWSYSPSLLRGAMRDRRKGWYRAVRVNIIEAAPAAASTKESDHG